MIKVEHTKTHKIYDGSIPSSFGSPSFREVLVTDAKLILIQESLAHSIIIVNGKGYKPILISETEKIEVGDWVYESTNPSIFQWQEWCKELKGINKFKLLALPEHLSPEQLQMIVDGKLKEDKCLVECNAGYVNPEWNPATIKLNPHITIHKSEERMYTRDEVIKEGNKLADHIQQLIRSTFGCDYLYNELKIKSKEWFEQNVK